MIDTYEGRPFVALATGAPTLTGVSYRVTSMPSGTEVIPETTTGITEPSPGVYAATVTLETAGTYLIVWTVPDGDPETEDPTATEEITVRLAAYTDLRPTLARLSGIMQARVYNATGEDEIGQFSDETTPTAEQAETMIDEALTLVAPRLGSVRTDLREMGASIVALRAAMLVETSYFPNETGAEDSAYAAYEKQYKDALADYDAAVDRDVGQDATASKVASVGMLTHYTAIPPE